MLRICNVKINGIKMKHKVIKGDNLYILQSKYMSSYINKIKLIYIDPPYNTRKSKTYQDNLELCVWENEISTVLMSLYSYLKQDGVIFISIDDNEYAQLKLLCDRIFGRNNFAGTFITRQAQRSNSRLINTVHEYIICYARDITKLPRFSIRRIKIPEQKNMINDIMTKVKSEMPHGIKRAESRLHGLIKDYCRRYSITWLKNYNCVDARGNVYFAADLSVPGMPRAVEIEKIGLHLEPLQTRGWVSDKKFIESQWAPISEKIPGGCRGQCPIHSQFLFPLWHKRP